MATSPIPQGFTTITPSLMVDGAQEAIRLYKSAFGATEDYVMLVPDGSGKVMHASLQVGTSKLFLGDVNPAMGCGTPSSASFYLYVDDVDAAFAQAKKAGLTEKNAPQDMFYGDRVGSLTDKFGIMWTLATHVRDVSEDELKEGAKKMCSKAA